MNKLFYYFRIISVVFLPVLISCTQKPSDNLLKIDERKTGHPQIIKNVDSLPPFKGIVNLKKNIDNSVFIDSIARTYKISYDLLKDDAYISYYQELLIGKDTCYLVEYNFRNGGGSLFPWKYQLIFNSRGKCLKIINALKFWLKPILNPKQTILITQFRTYHGNGTYRIYEIRPDQVITLFDGETILGKNRFLQTVQVDVLHERVIYPRELLPAFEDINKDTYNDLTFSGYHETRSEASGYEKVVSKQKFKWVFPYDTTFNRFKYDSVKYPIDYE